MSSSAADWSHLAKCEHSGGCDSPWTAHETGKPRLCSFHYALSFGSTRRDRMPATVKPHPPRPHSEVDNFDSIPF
ncbi:hypothetical protein [Sinimarinibacterium sp. NLF-5-8]|uniref:hypothetical protein n=1 Tax=Sinimarinibacterium sp. NLF-5-8 TaxID=2698684 RepID=UPI00137BD865|nr:hypothetical protein [Sinimarinibacterium sp. NLF-5-8]QHS09069.1 hypothetical protein GT972_02175 [Sinimarinibacterium sp. NLF-5-8]